MKSNKRQYIIGIDGGGTKTIAIIASLNGKEVVRVNAGASNPHAVGFEKSAFVITNLIKSSCRKVNCEISDICNIVIGIAGLGRDMEKQKLNENLVNIGGKALVSKIKLETDVRIAMEAALPGGEEGVILIGGTGSIALYRTKENIILRAGGWGRTLGDDGSGYAIARDAIREVLKEHEGRAKKTRLTSRLKKFYALKNVNQIISTLQENSAALALFAPQVIESAESGDAVAKDILTIHALSLAEAVESLLLKSKPGIKIPVVFFGSLLEHSNHYSKMVKEILLEMIPNIEVKKSNFPPVYGALFLAGRT